MVDLGEVRPRSRRSGPSPRCWRGRCRRAGRNSAGRPARTIVGRVGHGVQHVALEPVERLDRQLDARPAPRSPPPAMCTSTSRSRSAAVGGSPVNTPSGWWNGPASTSPPAARAGSRPPSAAGRARPAATPGPALIALCASSGSTVTPVAAQALVAQHAADGREVLGVALEHRHLDAVVAGRLELLEEREVLLGDVGGPEQQVEADPHRLSSRTSRSARPGPSCTWRWPPRRPARSTGPPSTSRGRPSPWPAPGTSASKSSTPSPNGGCALVSSLPSGVLVAAVVAVDQVDVVDPAREPADQLELAARQRLLGLPSCRAPTTATIWPWQVS